jgi:hypothetical protein
MEAYKAAYPVDPSSDADGPSCASHPEFCFLCQFQADASAGDDNDLYSSIVDLIHGLCRGQSKELSVVVNVVYGIYKSTVQPHVTWDNVANGVVTENPAWSKASIRRHLVYSRQFSYVFSSVIRSIFHSVIMKQNETMLDADTHLLVEETRRSFCDTVAEFRKFETWAASQDGESRKRKAPSK